MIKFREAEDAAAVMRRERLVRESEWPSLLLIHLLLPVMSVRPRSWGDVTALLSILLPSFLTLVMASSSFSLCVLVTEREKEVRTAL